MIRPGSNMPLWASNRAAKRNRSARLSVALLKGDVTKPDYVVELSLAPDGDARTYVRYTLRVENPG